MLGLIVRIISIDLALQIDGVKNKAATPNASRLKPYKLLTISDDGRWFH